MKKKIGELYDKPIVIGNKNEVEKHEIHIDELSGGGGEDYSDWPILIGNGAYVVAPRVLVSGTEDLNSKFEGNTLYGSVDLFQGAIEDGYTSELNWFHFDLIEECTVGPVLVYLNGVEQVLQDEIEQDSCIFGIPSSVTEEDSIILQNTITSNKTGKKYTIKFDVTTLNNE